MLRELEAGSWAHFEQRECFCRLLEAGSDVLLVGSPRAGKRRLLSDLKLDDGGSISIECSIVQSAAGIQHELLRHLHQLVPMLGQKGYPRSFEAAVRHFDLGARALRLQAPPRERKRVRVVFRNAERYFKHDAEDFRAFFARYLSFAQLALDGPFALQTVVLSRADLPLPFARCELPYPDNDQLRLFVARCATNLYNGMRGRPEALRAQFNKFIASCLAFDVLFRNFDAMELVVDKLLYMLKKSYADARNDAAEIDKQVLFANCVRLFNQNPRRVFSRKSELLEIVQTVTPNAGSRESIDRAQLDCFDAHTETCKDLPVIARYALLAVRMCQVNTPSGDLLLANAKRNAKQHGRSPKAAQLKRPARYAHSWRVWNVMEMLFRAPGGPGGSAAPEGARTFHSAEFYLVFDFLERVGLIAASSSSRHERYYRLTCDMELVRKIKHELGFGGEIVLDVPEDG